MSNTSLFPEPEIPIIPVQRPEPLLWVKRVVLVSELKPDARLLRKPIELRPGLNIVRVAKAPKGETRRIGNSVGKTLLTRLIRYSLGEAHFGTVKTTQAVSIRNEKAHVIAEIRVNGESWVTCRPLKDASIGKSFCLRTNEWRIALEEDTQRIPFSEILEFIDGTLLSELPKWDLPNEGRTPRWLDVLGWLARDQDCRFQHANEWRDPDARSGTGRLNRDDASLLSAWVMGLLDNSEIREQEKRATLHSQKSIAETRAKNLTQYMEGVRPALCERLKVHVDELDNGLSENFVLDAINKTKRALEYESRNNPEDDEFGTLQDEVVGTAAAVKIAESELIRLNGLADVTRENIQACKQLPVKEFRDKFNVFADCPLEKKDCPNHPSSTTALPDPEREPKIKELKDHLARYLEQANECKASIPKLEKAMQSARDRWNNADRERRQRLVELGRSDALAEEYARYRKARSDQEAALITVEKLKKQIAESLERRRLAQSVRDKRHRAISALFDRTIKELIDQDASGTMTLDARGLHPAPDATAGVSGAGLNTLATVIGFDLACLAGAISGVGHHPGFVIHDSPQNADIEMSLYQRVFEWVRRLEELYGPAPVGFQYIVTTTTPPPPSCQAEPYVCLTLDAREEQGFLLGIRW